MEDDNNRAKWKFFLEVIQIIINLDGLIFGGAVRDIYMRDYAARKFYKKYGARNISNGENWDNKSYTDSTFDSETKDRYILPNDIDAMIHHSKLQKLYMILKNKHFKVITLFARDAKKYLPNIQVDEGEIVHYKIKIRTDLFVRLDAPHMLRGLIGSKFQGLLDSVKELNDMMGAITIDLMVNMTDKDFDPPFGNLDFECNGLILNNDGIRISRCLRPITQNTRRVFPLDIADTLKRIQEDIVNKRAVPICDSNFNKNYRIMKMISKGYTIIFQYIQKIENITESCIICHEDCTPLNHYKLSCCNARYHANCLIQAGFMGQTAISITKKCIMCRQKIDLKIYTELELFRQKNAYQLLIEIPSTQEALLNSDTT